MKINQEFKIDVINKELTGKCMFRKNWKGKLILCVEYRCFEYDDFGPLPMILKYRDAKISDFERGD